ncbi:phosphatase [Vibrio nitrifigilis]|uniref:Phosphatase n=1 Tax=Vibrio nitrifigilis TaxID=2789781 RepID=A0ABS0GL55_9VIBR|nr:phosphatase [Vibrio nitrifigilis]MBF9003163.1 phosphatase [Vibrio nitrifigilis]
MKILVDTHTHTYASGHAYSTLIENARSAKESGLAMFCTTDHAHSMPGAPHFWFFVNQKILPRFIKGVAVIRGVEANIMNEDGDVDIPEQVDSRLDWMIGSLHEPVVHPSTLEQHTTMLVNAIKQGRIDALGHLGNPRFDFDFEAVISCAAEHNVAIEINNSSLDGHSRVGSKERCYQIAEIAKAKGAYITTGSDAHFCQYIGGLDTAIELIDTVGISTDKVITHNPQQFLNFLRLRGHEIIPEFDLHFIDK